jgi:hypothetical protein
MSDHDAVELVITMAWRAQLLATAIAGRTVHGDAAPANQPQRTERKIH